MKELRQKYKYLARYLYPMWFDCQSFERECETAWDWEMVYEVIHPAKARSFFAGVLWKGLRALEDQNGTVPKANRVLVPDGTKQELLRFLTHEVAKSERTLWYSRKAGRMPGLPEPRGSKVPSKSDWPDVSASVASYSIGRSQPIDLLMLALDKYMRPMPLQDTGATNADIQTFERRLKDVRGDVPDINSPDAINLATIKARSSNQANEVALISSTRAVANQGGELVRDPFWFALNKKIAQEYPDREEREQRLSEMLHRVFTAIKTSGAPALNSVEGETGTPEDIAREFRTTVDTSRVGATGVVTRRRRAAYFEAFLSSLADDPVLAEISEFLADAQREIANLVKQATKISDDRVTELSSDMSHVSKVKAKAHLCARHIGKQSVSAGDLGLHAETEFAASGVLRSRVVDDRKSIVLWTECFDNVLTVAWPTQHTVDDVLDLIFRRRSTVLASIACQYAERSSESVGSVRSNDEAQKFIRTRAEGSRLTLLRVDFGDIIVWYDEFGLYRQRMGHRSGSTSTTVAAQIHDRSVLHDVVKLFDLSGANWKFSGAIEEMLSGLWRAPEGVPQRHVEIKHEEKK